MHLPTTSHLIVLPSVLIVVGGDGYHVAKAKSNLNKEEQDGQYDLLDS